MPAGEAAQCCVTTTPKAADAAMKLSEAPPWCPLRKWLCELLRLLAASAFCLPKFLSKI